VGIDSREKVSEQVQPLGSRVLGWTNLRAVSLLPIEEPLGGVPGALGLCRLSAYVRPRQRGNPVFPAPRDGVAFCPDRIARPEYVGPVGDRRLHSRNAVHGLLLRVLRNAREVGNAGSEQWGGTAGRAPALACHDRLADFSGAPRARLGPPERGPRAGGWNARTSRPHLVRQRAVAAPAAAATCCPLDLSWRRAVGQIPIPRAADQETQSCRLRSGMEPGQPGLGPSRSTRCAGLR